MTSKSSSAALLVLLWFSWIRVRAERWQSCLLQSACVLPCPFDPGPEVVVHWLKPPDDKSSVHSFYHEADQLGRQHPRFRGRTSLFKDQIPKGNASLRITPVQVQDRGRYKCYTSTTHSSNEDYVSLEVQAPVSSVSVVLDGDQLRCRSERIYPRPTVTWTPSSDPNTSVSESDQGLFSVSSSVPLSESEDEYICNISTEHSWRSATYRRAGKVRSSGSRTVVPCVETERSINRLLWTFNTTQNILERTGSNTDYGPGWESRLEQVQGSELVLTSPGPELQGLYTCRLHTESGTFLTVTELQVIEATTADPTVVIVAVLVPLVLISLLILGLFFYKKHKDKKKSSKKQPQVAESREGEPLKSIPTEETRPSNGDQPTT